MTEKWIVDSIKYTPNEDGVIVYGRHEVITEAGNVMTLAEEIIVTQTNLQARVTTPGAVWSDAEVAAEVASIKGLPGA